MATRPRGYGLTSEIKNKIDAKYSVDLEVEARQWMEDVLGHPISDGDVAAMPPGKDRLHAELKSGQVLCAVINAIKPGCVKKVNESKMAFKMMENTGNFLDGCVSLGMNKTDLFQSADLYDKTNMPQVVNTIFALGRKAQSIGFEGPKLGVKESESNPRNFTEEQLRAGEGVIGLQSGTNKGHNQKGMNFGRARSILN